MSRGRSHSAASTARSASGESGPTSSADGGAAGAAIAAGGAPTRSVKHLDWVLVSCTGLTPGAAWLGLFYPANASTAPRAPLPYPHTAPWTENAPAEYVDLTAAADGSASYAFRLVNSLTDAQVHAFAGSSQGTPARVASSGPITFTDADAPMRVHLGRLQDPSTLRVIWNSRHNDDNPAVRWGFTQGGPYSNVAYAESFSYAREDLCPNVDGSESVATGHGWFWSGYYNYATISRLVPGDKRVIYYVAGSDVNGFSREFSTLPPPAPAADTPTNIVLVADMGVTTLDGTTDHWAEPDAGETIDHMRDHVQSGTGYDWNMVLHSGDLSYATGYQLKWPLFESKLHEGLSDRVPYMVNLGNHERDYPGTTGHYPTSLDSGGECGIATQIRFPSPAPGSAAFKDEEYYSLVVGNTYVVMIGTEIEVGPGSDQYLWIESTLASVNRSATPWVIFAGHRPMYYVDNVPDGGVIDANFAQFEPLLMKYQVDLVMWGHVHNMYASCPVFKGACVTTPQANGYLAPVHISIGNGGQGLSPINPSKLPVWATYQGSFWGYSTWSALSATTATVNMYRNSDNSTGTQTLAWTFSLIRQPA